MKHKKIIFITIIIVLLLVIIIKDYTGFAILDKKVDYNDFQKSNDDEQFRSKVGDESEEFSFGISDLNIIKAPVSKTGKTLIKKEYHADRTIYDYGNGKKTVVIGDFNLQADNGSYFPPKDLVKLRVDRNRLLLSREDRYYSINPYVNIRGKIVSLADFKKLAGTNGGFKIIEHDKNYEFALYLNTSLSLTTSFDEVLLKLEDLNSTSLLKETQKNDTHVIDSKIDINYHDLENSGFSINVLNNSFISITGVSDKNNLYLDPFVEINTDDTGIMEDGMGRTTSLTREWGTSSVLRIVLRGAGDREWVSMLRFNLSSVPNDAVIENAIMRLYQFDNYLDGGESIEIIPHHVYSPYKIGGTEWDEGNADGGSCTGNEFCYSTRPVGAANMNITGEDSPNANVTVSGPADTGNNAWYSFNVTKMVRNATATWKNITIFLNSSVLSGNPACCGIGDRVEYSSKENADGNNPMLNITYHLSTAPTFSSGKDNSTSDEPTSGEVINFSIGVQDNWDLDYIIYSTNDSGSWSNSTASQPSGITTANYTNWTTESVDTTSGTIGWQVYANDSGGNINGSGISTFSVRVLGTLNVSLQNPVPDTSISIEQYNYTWFNATVNCTSGISGCVDVWGTLRYNSTGTTPNLAVNVSAGSPFNIIKVLGATPTSNWNKTYNIGGSDAAKGVAIDSSDNIYVVGYNGSNDWYVMKIDNNGVNQWNKTYNPAGGDQANDIAIDSNDDVYVVGKESNVDWRVMKINSNGVSLWNRTYDPGNTDVAYDVAVDSNDNIYIVGNENPSGSDMNWRIVKLNSTGHSLWNRTYDFATGFSVDAAYGVAVDSSDNIYVVGKEEVGIGNNDWRITKLDSDGVNQWNKTYDVGAIPFGVAIDSNVNLYVVGNENPSGSDMNWRIVKLNSTGHSLWNRTYDPGGTDEAYRVTVDSSDNIYVVGYEDSADWRVQKIDSDGVSLWNRTYNPSGTDYAYDIAADSVEDLYVVGMENNVDWRVMKLAVLNNPAYCETLSENEICNLRFKLNGTALGTRQLDVLFNSSNTNVADNDTKNVNLTIAAKSAADSCTYSSGDWEIDCSDNCKISSEVDVGGNDIIITGTGTLVLTANVINYNNLIIDGTDADNKCEVTCSSGCFK